MVFISILLTARLACYLDLDVSVDLKMIEITPLVT